MTDSRKILLVDDDELFTFTAGYTLNRLYPGIEIITCRHGEEALERLNDLTPEVMFLDLEMPLMDGWELLDVLIGRYGDLSFPVVIVTASEDPVVAVRASEHPLKPAFIVKSITPEKKKSLGLNLNA